jgi:hypothetical protein
VGFGVGGSVGALFVASPVTVGCILVIAWSLFRAGRWARKEGPGVIRALQARITGQGGEQPPARSLARTKATIPPRRALGEGNTMQTNGMPDRREMSPEEEASYLATLADRLAAWARRTTR